MLASLMLLVAATGIIAAAGRLYPPGLEHRVASHAAGGYKVPDRFPPPQMQWYLFPPTTVQGEVQDMFPATMVHSVDTRLLLGSWLKTFRGNLWRKFIKGEYVLPKPPEVTEGRYPTEEEMRRWSAFVTGIAEPLLWETHSSAVLETMLDNVTAADDVAAVGLIPKQGSGLATVPPVLAVAFLERRRFKDDPEGSLRRVVEAQFGLKAARGALRRRKAHFDAVVVNGLAAAPNQIPSRSSRVLAAKIAEWAQTQQELLVVSEHALRDSGGYNLTAYYAGLGFKNVGYMDNGSPVLVYWVPSTRATDEFVGRYQSMVRLNV